MKRPGPQSTLCANCGLHGPIPLWRDEVCATCMSTSAWEDFADQPLVIRAEEIASSMKAQTTISKSAVLQGALAVGTCILLVLTILALANALAPLPIASLQQTIDSILSSSAHAQWLGTALFVGALGAIIALRITKPTTGLGSKNEQHKHQVRRYRWQRLVLPSLYSVALLIGISSFVVGAIQGWAAGGTSAPYTTMPPISQLDELGSGQLGGPTIRRIAESTVILVAPDADGDARASALGTGAIIARQSDRAWIVTCSHVAMPYMSTAAMRTPADAHPVWIEFSDGRGAIGKVVWTAPPPLDVAIVAIDIDSPPPAVEVSPSTQSLNVDSPVVYIPNPLLHGWKVHRGSVEFRKNYDTPAGSFALVQTSLPVQSGDSGSGLYNAEGQLVGLNTWTRLDDEGLHGISLPSEVLQSMASAITGNTLGDLDQLIQASNLEKQ